MPPRVLLAWEGGAGRGHVSTLRTIAAALGDAVTCDAALCRMDHAAEIAPVCDGVFFGARLWTNRDKRTAAGDPHTATWGDFLGDLNFWDTEFLVRQIGWWLATIKARQSRLVIADFAPCAQLAARVAGIPSVSTGTGYSVPPAGIERFPVLLPQYADCVHEEADLLFAVNAALAHFGADPLGRLSDIYADAVALPRTISALDPYASFRTGPVLPPLGQHVPLLDEHGDEIFVYFSTSELENNALVTAVTGLDLPVRAFLPGADAAMLTRFTDSGVMVEVRPVAAEHIGRRSRLLIHAGQHGSLCMGLGLGVPQIAVPQHLEQRFHSGKAALLAPLEMVEGSASAADIGTLIRNAYENAAAARTAREAAGQLRGDLFGDAGGIARAAILPLVA